MILLNSIKIVRKTQSARLYDRSTFTTTTKWLHNLHCLPFFRIGRRKTLIIAITLQFGFSMSLAWSPSYPVYAVLRFCIGMCNVGMFMTSYVLGRLTFWKQQFFRFRVKHFVIVFFFSIINFFVWRRITDEGSVPEIRWWSILLIKSELKWCIYLSISLFLFFNSALRTTWIWKDMNSINSFKNEIKYSVHVHGETFWLGWSLSKLTFFQVST